jgi:hypothetical protein
VTANLKSILALELYEEPAKVEKMEILSVTYIEQALDEEIAKLLRMQIQVIDKIKKLLNGSNGEIHITEDLNNE